MVSELLEEAGIDRERLRDARRQVLQGIVMLCEWQLQRMEASEPPAPPRRRARKVDLD
jgi:hypothetical protein